MVYNSCLYIKNLSQMKADIIINILNNSNLCDKNKFETICNILQEYSTQPDNILNCYRVLSTLKLELLLLSRDADNNSKMIIRRIINAVSTELDIIKYKIDHPELIPKEEIPKFQRKHWTASVSGLVEIIYLMKDCVDNGNVEIKELADWFEYIFQIKLDNIYKIIEQIANRKKDSKTKFLDEQKLNFVKFLEDFSTRNPARYRK